MLTPAPTRIAMWSGPRSISTALMRSWGSRADTAVVDEPFYAHYLRATGIEHPGRADVLARHESDWRAVAARLTGPVPDGKPIFYQKHMAHHLLPDVDRGWLGEVRHAFLIRNPRELLTSLVRVVPDPGPEDTGMPQQCELFDELRRATGAVPPVLDARDVLEDPRGQITRLCAALEVPFDEAMLSWRSGPRATDGAWAPHWYESVESSTGFQPYEPKREALPERLAPVLRECVPHYRRLYEHRLRS